MHKKRRLSDYAIIFFVSSITLFVYGLGYQLYHSLKTTDPVKDVNVVGGGENIVSVTPSDGSEVVSNDTSGDNVQNNSYDVATLDKVNDSLRKKIQNTYSVKVLYGQETLNYSVKNGKNIISTSPIDNAVTINSQLNRLKNTLALYPSGMFKEISDGGIPLTIVLINNYSDKSITGITDSTYSYAHISIAAIYPFEESFYHESYHYIERYMFKKGAAFSSWNTLNPDGFKYGDIYSNYSYSNTFSSDAPFVNNYAQFADTEDRASTFEYMMASSKASCLNKNTTVWRKANYMAKTMDAVLNTVNANTIEYWERYL